MNWTSGSMDSGYWTLGVHFGLLDSALRAKGFGGLALPGLKPRLPGGQHEDSAIS